MPPRRSKSRRGRKPKSKVTDPDSPPSLEENLNCHICDKKFTATNSLKIHVNGHTREVTYPCPVCGRTFLRKVYVNSHLKMHKREEQQQLPVLPFKCKGIECKQSFVSQNLLDKHQSKHTHVCPFCTQAATNRRLLNYHIMKHTGEFPEMCKICKKWYTSAKILLSHKCRKAVEVENKNQESLEAS